MIKKIIFGIAFFLSVTALIFYRGGGATDQANQLLSMASFFFGIFVAFSTANSQTRFNKIIENLKIEEGSLLFTFYLVKSFGKEAQEKIRSLIDDYLTLTIDYKLKDYSQAGSKLEELLYQVLELDPKTKAQDSSQSKIIDQMEILIVNRKETEVAISQSISNLEWISIITLFSVIVGLLVFTNNGDLLSILISMLLVCAAFLLVITLWSIDSLSWNIRNYIWVSLCRTFMRMNLLPYVPSNILQTHAFPLTMFEKGQQIRVPHYNNKYPDLSDRKITIVTVA